METENHTPLSQFLLLGLSEDPKLQPFLFGLFLSMYLVTVLGNLLIILAVSSDAHLHTPMYFFLSNLSLVDICFISMTVPKMLVNIHTQGKDISYIECLTQTYFFTILVGVDNFLLTIMAYDRFVVICHPLNYTVIMNTQLCVLLVLMSWLITFWVSLIHILLEGSHLCVVSLFCGTALGVYLSSALTHSSQKSSIASVLYTVVTPMLNPFIYSLRNKDMKGALGTLLGTASSRP
ncbi:Olfactory receptor 867 [Sciurus carolinensis]|uniref:Olfactory receptor 867 n=1 Tax=Sciurus carolinensis TaxID=30640 RepID=A0AA41MVL7_SCICA|nr:Olfactory receptor 867 [Sciurus carolinensis]